MNIDFKPKVLYPTVDHKIVDPTSYEEREQLIYNMVRHYKERAARAFVIGRSRTSPISAKAAAARISSPLALRGIDRASKETGHADMPTKCDQDWTKVYGVVRDF